ncbi:MAG: DNA polymerase III subunit delta [Pseudomonadota bacterium]|nr:DNA polymerase III subunit delta [Pseudomonadota bacterium]
MAVIQPSALEGFLNQRALGASGFLVYGPDTGKVHETARSLVQRIAGSLEDAFRVVHLKEDHLVADPGRLADEFYAMAMLGGSRAVWVSECGAAFASAVAGLLGSPAGGNAIIAEAGNLKKESALVRLFDKADGAYVVPCYVDRTEDLSEVVTAVIAKAGFKIARDAKTRLVAALGDDRALTLSEIDKLLLYVHGRPEVTAADVDAVCSGRIAPPLDDLCDAVLGGDVGATDRLLQTLLEGGTAGSRLLAAAASHVALLRGLAAEVAAGMQITAAVETARPRIFWLRKRAVTDQLQRWQDGSLSTAARTLAEATLATRELPALEPQIASRALLALARQASRRRSAA